MFGVCSYQRYNIVRAIEGLIPSKSAELRLLVRRSHGKWDVRASAIYDHLTSSGWCSKFPPKSICHRLLQYKVWKEGWPVQPAPGTWDPTLLQPRTSMEIHWHPRCTQTARLLFHVHILESLTRRRGGWHGSALTTWWPLNKVGAFTFRATFCMAIPGLPAFPKKKVGWSSNICSKRILSKLNQMSPCNFHFLGQVSLPLQTRSSRRLSLNPPQIHQFSHQECRRVIRRPFLVDIPQCSQCLCHHISPQELGYNP